MADVNYILIPFEGRINPGYPTGIKLYFWATNKIDRETDKLDISVSNPKEIIEHFLSFDKKYVWGRLAFMVGTDKGTNKNFRVLENIQL